MRFIHKTIVNQENGVSAQIFVPADADERIPGDRFVEVSVANETRILSARVLGMLLQFNKEPEKRRRLGHECGVFALACVTGNDFRNRQFGEAGRVVCTCYPNAWDDPLNEPDLDEGQVVFTAPELLYKSQQMPSNKVHLAVRASSFGQRNALYASKLGTIGPVVLHRFGDLHAYYNAQVAGEAGNIRVIPISSSR